MVMAVEDHATTENLFLSDLLKNSVNTNDVPAIWLMIVIGGSLLTVAGMLEWTGLAVAKANHGAELAFGTMLILLTSRFWLRSPVSLAQRIIRDFSEYMLIFLASLPAIQPRPSHKVFPIRC
jgi:hypothetical protein